jgi:amino acid adenylation domain-containing protein
VRYEQMSTAPDILSAVWQHVMCSPDAIAVYAEEDTLTYRTLWSRAQGLSATLHSHGIGASRLVAIAGERSSAMIIAALGTLMSGAAYVGIDTTLSRERADGVLSAAGIDTLLFTDLAPPAFASCGIRCLSVRQNIDGANHQHVAVRPDPASPAVGIFTSGSTGHPKCVLISHACVAARAANGYPLDTGDLFKSSLSLAAHISSFLIPMMKGHPVYPVPSRVTTSFSLLADWAARCATKRLVMVPSQLEGLLAAGDRVLATLAGVTSVIVTGETLTERTARTFMERMPWAQLKNAWGASETTGIVTIGEVSKPGDITVGCPIADFAIEVLDESMRPVANGTPGELCVSGSQVSCGYLNDPTGTNERFRVVRGRRLYLTGDIGRVRADGRYEILGRKDLEVKVRGHRVNPVEVELALTTLPDVASAVVVTPQRGQTTTMHAYVTGPKLLNGRQLRCELQKTLPGYLVPTAIEWWTDLPKTLSGKLDRQALLTDALSRGELSTDLSIPHGDDRQILLAMWRHELGDDRINVDDKFFYAGGDSLGAMRLAMRIEEVFGVPMLLDDIGAYPSVMMMHAYLRSKSGVRNA